MIEYKFDEQEAQRAVDFFEKLLHHVKGEWAGQPFLLASWEKEFIRELFGWRREDGTRRYRMAYLEIPRKNGKSSLAAGLALYLLFADREPGAEIYSAAGDRGQAALVFEIAKGMIERSPVLRKRCEVFKHSVYVPSSGSVYKVLSAEAYSKHGINAHGIIFDELHVQPNRELWDVLTTSTGARRQPIVVAITTAGYDRHSICWEIHDYALKVRDGIVEDDTFLPIIYTVGEKEDWTDPEVWAKANPNLGISLKREYLEQECRRAKEVPAYENTFRRLHLNQWTEQAVRWLPMDHWDECAGGEIDEEALAGKPCYAGLDLASTIDIAALVLLFPGSGEDGPRYRVICRFWVPEENLRERADRDRVPYDQWAREGWITPTEGNVIDYDRIRADINVLGGRFEIREIAIDRWNSTQLQTQLDGDGFTVVPFGQGFGSMSAPTKELEGLVLGKKIEHGGNPVLRWMASNVSVRQDPAGNLKPDKSRSAEKIDGIVALVMALGRAMVHRDEDSSVYEDRGIVLI